MKIYFFKFKIKLPYILPLILNTFSTGPFSEASEKASVDERLRKSTSVNELVYIISLRVRYNLKFVIDNQ